jgi:hypothetical protein
MKAPALGLAAACLLLGTALAQDPFSKPGGDDWNLGPLGIGAAVDGTRATVRVLTADGPAERAGLKAGEAIVGVEGSAFEPKADPVIAIELACDAAETRAKKEAVVTLLVERNGQPVPVKVAFPSLGKHSGACPKKCEKCKKAVAMGAAYLLSQQASDGHFPTELGGKTGKVVVTSISGLALMAAGGADDAVSRAADYVIAHIGKEDDSGLKLGGMGGGNWNQVNWELGYGAIFLAELVKKTKRADARAKLEEVAKLIEANQEASGGWAHGPGGPNALGYLELEIVGNFALMGLGGAKRNGIALDKSRLEKALAWIEATGSGDGGVGYSPREGQKGFGEAGRTSGAIAAYSLLGLQQQPFFEKMVAFYRAHATTLSTGHVSPCMHLLSGAIASYGLGPRDWETYIATYRPWIYAARKPDGSFAPTPTHETQALHSNTDLSVGTCWTTATYVLILALPQEKVPLLVDRAGAEKPGKAEKPARSATGAAPPTEKSEPEVK